MKNSYRIESWKLRVEGEYENEELAIKDLSDKYMQCSKCDAPGDHPLELWAGNKSREVNLIAKSVCFSIKTSVFGREQWVEKYSLNIYPFKKEHWWPCEGFIFDEIDFKYEIKR